jgi:hypothetical protein
MRTAYLRCEYGYLSRQETGKAGIMEASLPERADG